MCNDNGRGWQSYKAHRHYCSRQLSLKQWRWTARADAVDVGDSPVLSLSTGAEDRDLTLFRTRRLGCQQGRPSSRTWIAKVGAPSPVGVGVCRQGGDGANTDVKTGGEYALHIA